jgi:hypothetical protein
LTLFDVDAPLHPSLPNEHGSRLRGLLAIAIVAVVGFVVGFGANLGLTLSRVPTRSLTSAGNDVPPVHSALAAEPSPAATPMPELVEMPTAASSTPATAARPADSAAGVQTTSGALRSRRRPSLRIPGASDNPY